MKKYERWIVYLLTFSSICFSSCVLCKEYPRIISEDNLGFDYIGAIVAILSLLVAVIAIMFAYNLTVFKHGVEARIKQLEEQIKSSEKLIRQDIEDSVVKSNDLITVRTGIDLFINKEVNDKSILKYRDYLSSLIESADLCAKINNPNISVLILNKLMKIFLEADNLSPSERTFLIDYEAKMYVAIEKNMKIIEESNMQGKLLNKDIQDHFSKFITIYKEKAENINH